MTKVELRWHTQEKEAYIRGLQKFDRFIMGRSVEVVTDHQSLQWMLESQRGKIARWACLLGDSKLAIVHKAGSKIQHVDFFTGFMADEEIDPIEYMMCYIIYSTLM